MMIKALDASPAIITVNGSRWSIHLASWAKLKLHYVLLKDYDPVIVLSFFSEEITPTMLLALMSIGRSLVALRKSWI